jgi:hypothetical protein
MDNRTIDVTSVGEAELGMALRLAWPGAPGSKATHYKAVGLTEKVAYYGEPTFRHAVSNHETDDGTPTLILFWHEERGSLPLPYALEIDEAIPFVSGWLKKAQRGPEPDHDGDNGEGWRVFTEAWGHVAGHQYAIVAVQPAWAMYGK